MHAAALFRATFLKSHGTTLHTGLLPPQKQSVAKQ